MVRCIAVVALLSLAGAAPARAQAAAPADPIRELLAEVRGLRAALERAATVGARIQLLVARVQIQEQRIADLTRRADGLRAEMRSVDQEMAAMAMQQKLMIDKDAPPEQREGMAEMIKLFAGNTERLEKRKQELFSEEQLVAQQISLDQGRWSDINDQLEQLERSLASGKQ
jgi:predicted  nucleic acid-binding Zn-ribbon protein